MLVLRFEPQIFGMLFYVQLNGMYMHFKHCTTIAQGPNSQKLMKNLSKP